jgi:tetratricopeptide (TPR) repeat protein
MLKKTFLAAALLILLVGCSSVYDTTLPVDLAPERIVELEAEIVKWDTMIIQTPALKKLVAEKIGTEQEEELPDEAGFFLTSDPTDFRPPADFFISKALAFEKLGRVGEAIRTYDELFQIYDNSSVGWNNRGRLYEKIGDAAEAVENYKKLIDVFSLTQYRFDIAAAWQKAGEIEKAKTAYQLWQKETGNKNSSFAAKIGL